MAKENGNSQENGQSINHHSSFDERVQSTLSAYANADAVEIDERISELDNEWDIERTLQLHAATLGIAGLVLGMVVNKKWFALPILFSSFLAQQAVQGWCPPIPILRRFGFRTRKEIDKERYALKAIRGDFRRTIHSPMKAWQSVQ